MLLIQPSAIVIQTRTDNDLQKRGQIRLKGMNDVVGELILALETKFYIYIGCVVKNSAVYLYTCISKNIHSPTICDNSGADVLYLYGCELFL